MQFGPDRPAGEPVFLVAQDVAVGVIVENDDHCVDSVLDRGSQLLGVEQKAAVPGQSHYRLVRLSHLGAQGRGVGVAQVAKVG